MSSLRVLLLMAVCAAPVFARAKPITFGVSGPWTKIADAVWNNDPTFGAGHNIVASGNEIYVVYSSDDTQLHGELQIWLAYSLDGGATFRHTQLVARGPTVGWNGAQVAIGPDPTSPGGRRLHVVWGDDVSGGEIRYAHAPLDPQLGAFSDPLTVSGGITAYTYGRAVATDPVGGVHVIFASGQGLFYSRSADGGETFPEIATPLGGGGYFPCVATDAAGDVFVLGPYYPGFPGLFYRRRLASEGAFGPAVSIDGIIADGPSCAAYDANHVYVSGNAGGVAVASTSNGGLGTADWSVRTVAAVPAYGDVKALAAGAPGVVAVAWPDYNGVTGVSFSRSTDGGITWSAPAQAALFEPVDDVRDVNLAIDPLGKALLDVSRNGEIVFTKEK